MQTIERGGYTRDEILSVLHSKQNTRHVRFRYDLLDKDEKFKKTLDTVVDGEVSMSAFSTIKRTAKFKIKEKYIPAYVTRVQESKSVIQDNDADFNAWSRTGLTVSNGTIKLAAQSNMHPNGHLDAGWNGIYPYYFDNGWNGSELTVQRVVGGAIANGWDSFRLIRTSGTDAIGVYATSDHMSGNAGDRIYVSFFFKAGGGMNKTWPDYCYLMSGSGNQGLSSNAIITTLSGGWKRFESWTDLTVAKNFTIMLGYNTNTPVNSYFEFCNIYVGKVPAVYNGVGISPVFDLSYVGAGLAPTLVTSNIDFTIDSPNVANGQTVPAFEVYSSFSLDGGTTWTNWVGEGDNTEIDNLLAGSDVSNLRVQFKYATEKYDWSEEPSISYLQASVTFERDEYVPETTEINYLSDRIQPFMEVKMPDNNWIEFPLGVFILSTPTRHDEINGVYREIEAYDGLVILDEDKFTARYNVRAGTKYTQAVIDILTSAGITKFNIADKADTLTADIEFKIGTSKLDAVNQLLSSINYTPIWVDANGYFTAYQYVSPTDRAEDYEYLDDELSVIYNEMDEELDLYGIPNVWVVTQSNPEKEPLVSTKTNDNPDSPTSTVNIGRNIVDFRQVDDISDQATLDAYVQRIAFESSQVFGKLKFKTALMPFHEYSDVFRVKYDALKIDYKFSETAWKMTLKAGGEMEHEVRRVVVV